MARILIPQYGEWYEEMAVVSCYYESEYEAKFKQHVGSVFPDYFVLTIKDTISSKNRKPRRPDLVLIKNDLSEWWLVEVELEGHALTHVLDQVRVFVNPDINYLSFGRKLKERFDEEYKGLACDFTEAKFQEMVLDGKLNVLVVVDEHIPKWESSLNKEGAKLCIFQVFKSTNATEAFRISGGYPRTMRKATHCSSFERDPNAYQIFEPDALGIQVGQTIDIIYNDRSVRFDIEDYGGKLVMKFNGRYNHVPTQKDYVLYIDNNSRFILKPN
jgi:hypothetical protein